MSTKVKDLTRGASVEEGRLNELRERKLMEVVPDRPPTPVAEISPPPGFVKTPFIKSITERALTYAEGGFPVHFRGPTGCGKTTLAIYLATQIGRPMMLLVGDEELTTSDLVGGEHGYHRKRVRDQFIHSVLKTEDRLHYRWVDSQLTVACQEGYTLIYDEFSRSRPEANNVLLPVLEERILILPTIRSTEGYLRAHPDFTAIFTSNPTEYAGVHLSQEALLDRMITIDITHFDRETELAITQARTGVSAEEAEKIVDLVRGFREATNSDSTPTVRSCIMIGKILAYQNANGGDLTFGQIVTDVLAREINPHGKPDKKIRDILLGLIEETG